MRPENVIAELLKSACPSIQYRIRREILGEPTSSDAMQALQAQILQDNAVKAIFNAQGQDGWFYTRFHGYDSHEAGIHLLCEKGVERQNPALDFALKALEMYPERATREMGVVGQVLDESFGGVVMIRATVFAYAGMEEQALVQEQVKVALEGFRAVLTVEAVDEIAEPYREKLVFKRGVRWPSIYHLRLLAFTRGWRTPNNRGMVGNAVQRLVRLSPLPCIYIRHKSQLIAPASFGMQDFKPALETMDSVQWMIWFQRMELLARLGVVASVPEIQNQVDALGDMLDKGEGWFTRPMTHTYFKHWGAYTGLMLEPDWRTAQRRIFDLTFRSLLIRHYSLSGSTQGASANG